MSKVIPLLLRCRPPNKCRNVFWLQVCLTDVEGLFDAAPDLPDSKLIPTYSPVVHDKIIKFGAKSTMGRGGMSSKVESAWEAAMGGVTTLIVNGKGFRPALVEAVSGEVVGTLFDKDAAERVRKDHAHVAHSRNTEVALLMQKCIPYLYELAGDVQWDIDGN